MSYEDVINIINAHYGWSMDAHEPEYKDGIKEKMQAMKQLVSELQAKAKAFDSLKNKLENEVKILSGNVSGFPYVDAPIDKSISQFERILEMMKKLESGGSDE